VAGRTNPIENKRLFHSNNVPDGNGAINNHKQNKSRKGRPITETQYPRNGSLDKPHGWQTDQYPERGLYCGLGLFSHAQRLHLLRLGNSYDCCARLTLIIGKRWQNTFRLAISSDYPHRESDEKPSGSAGDSASQRVCDWLTSSKSCCRSVIR
jgi:hypothetical protein